MKSKLLLVATLGALVASTQFASAQNPPGGSFQDRGIREENDKPGLRGAPEDRLREPRGTVGQGLQQGPRGQPEPPGGRFQDEKNNEEQGNPPQGDPLRR
jgi:hypothetical protein